MPLLHISISAFEIPFRFWRLNIKQKKKNIDIYTLVTRFCTKKGCFNTSECDMIREYKGSKFSFSE